MKFQPGHKFSKGGVKGNKGGGRDSAKRKEVMRMVAEEVKKFIEEEVRPVLGVYKKIAMGVKRKRFNPKTGAAFLETEYDPATVRHWVDKFVPPIQRIDATDGSGRPLVPVNIFAPDFNNLGTPTEPEPEKPQPKDNALTK